MRTFVSGVPVGFSVDVKPQPRSLRSHTGLRMTARLEVQTTLRRHAQAGLSRFESAGAAHVLRHMLLISRSGRPNRSLFENVSGDSLRRWDPTLAARVMLSLMAAWHSPAFRLPECRCYFTENMLRQVRLHAHKAYRTERKAVRRLPFTKSFSIIFYILHSRVLGPVDTAPERALYLERR